MIIIVTDADCNNQHAKKVVSDSPELVNFAIGLVNSVLHLCEGQVMFFWGIQITEILYKRQIQNSCELKADFQADLTK